MKIKKLSGLEQELFCTIGRYAMDKSIIDLLGNEITTSFKHTWYLVYDENENLNGFCSVQNQNYTARLANLVSFKNDNFELITILLPEIERDLKPSGFKKINCYCRVEELNNFHKVGFETTKSRVKWATVSKEIK